MTLSLRAAVAPIILGAAAAVGVVACSPSHSTAHVSASSSAAAKADAKALAAKCIPVSTVAQIKLAHALTTKPGRANLEATCGIAPNRKSAFEASVLSAAETGHLTTAQGRTEFFGVTLPKLIEEDQG